MVTEVTEKRVITEKDARAEFDGRWVLLHESDFPESEYRGYLVAYGDGTPEDRDALRLINKNKYDGQAFLMRGYVPKEYVVYGVYDC
jgi:hypothetical protein